ncbi:uncharacterized protein LOC112517621 [Cynara cardunculus var. scolymus]|uniref:uncharacterized protein LOC112517621 n=1 Tax=Cynara cardunculus var. scolymus TaxID=59895 RepID=UPI000D6241F8|nr:uncharacterized protein LOC112517621 [Cynara cardunculus var. scolymus]
MDMDMPHGTIVFSTVGRPNYGFDVFSTPLPLNLHHFSTSPPSEHRLTDGVSVNFNAQFVGPDDDLHRLVYVSERNGLPQIYLGSDLLPSAPASLFHDRPIVKDGRLYFISAHQPTDAPFQSWSALYTLQLDDATTLSRLTPYGCVDYSPSLSQSGDLVAVASYGSRPWPGEFHDLKTDIVVFRLSDSSNRFLLCSHGGWPTWSGDSTIYFHRQADDGWWSIFRLDLPSNFDLSATPPAPRRVTPPGLHCFTPAAMHDRQQIAVATRRKGETHRHIEIFDVELNKFYPITKFLNPNIHHYNPFVSPNSGFLGYHRFRGESSDGESMIPNLDQVSSPIKGLRMLRLNGAFPSFSPSGDLIAFNPDFDSNAGIDIVKSDGSQRWTILKGRTSFYNAWSPTEKNVIFTSIGPIFSTVKATVQIARISFDLQGEAEVKILTKEETGNNAFPSCSPDGKSLVFRSGRSGHKNLYILDAVEGEFKGDNGIRQVTDGPWIDTMPSWSPDGNLIAFSSNRHNPDNPEAFSIYVMGPDGSNVRRIFVVGGEGSEEVDRERINHVCFSADGAWLLFTANIGGVTAEPVSLPNQFQPYGDLYVCRLDGSGLQRLTWNGYENGTPAWHPSGSGMNNINKGNGNKLLGEFDEPLWIVCDF